MDWNKIQKEIATKITGGAVWKCSPEIDGVRWVTDGAVGYAIPVAEITLPLNIFREVGKNIFESILRTSDSLTEIKDVIKSEDILRDDPDAKIRKRATIVRFSNDVWAYKTVAKNFLGNKFRYYGATRRDAIVVTEGDTIVGLFMGIFH